MRDAVPTRPADWDETPALALDVENDGGRVAIGPLLQLEIVQRRSLDHGSKLLYSCPPHECAKLGAREAIEVTLGVNSALRLRSIEQLIQPIDQQGCPISRSQLDPFAILARPRQPAPPRHEIGESTSCLEE